MVVLSPLYMFGTLGTRSGQARLCVGLCEARLRGIGGACGDPAYVFAAFFTMPGHSRLRVGLCDARLRGVGGACSNPPYVFAAFFTRLGCSRVCAGLYEACVRGRCLPSLCVRHPGHDAGALEIARGVVSGPSAGDGWCVWCPLVMFSAPLGEAGVFETMCRVV